MLKKLIGGSSILLFTQFFQLIGNFLFYLLLILNLNDKKLGIFYSFVSLITLTSLFASSGLETFLIVHLNKEGKPDILVKKIMRVLIIIVILISLITVSLYTFLMQSNVIKTITFIFLILQHSSMLLIVFISSSFQRQKKFKMYSILRISSILVKFSAFYLLIHYMDSLDAALISNSLNFLIPCVIFIVFALKPFFTRKIELEKIKTVHENVPKAKIKYNIKYYLKYYFLTLLTSSVTPGIIFFSSFLISDEIIGRINAINTFPQTIWMLSSSVVVVSFPYMIENTKNNDIFIRSFQLIGIIGVPLFVLLNFGLDYLLEMLNLTDRFIDFKLSLIILSFAWLMKLISDLVQRSLIVKKKFKEIYIGYIMSYFVGIITLILFSFLFVEFSIQATFVSVYCVLSLFYAFSFSDIMKRQKSQINYIIRILFTIPLMYALSNIIVFIIDRILKMSNISIFINILIRFPIYFMIGLTVSTIFSFKKGEVKNLFHLLKSIIIVKIKDKKENNKKVIQNNILNEQ